MTPDGFWIGSAFGFKHASCEAVYGVALEHRYLHLKYRGAVVVDLVDNMNGAAADLVPGLKNRGMHVVAVHTFAAVRWQKSGVNVEDTSGEARGHGEVQEVSSEQEQVRGFFQDPGLLSFFEGLA